MRTRKSGGIALITVLLLLPILVALGLVLTTVGVHNQFATRWTDNSKRAEYVAEAGAVDGYEWVKSSINANASSLTNNGFYHSNGRTVSSGGLAEQAFVSVQDNTSGSATATNSGTFTYTYAPGLTATGQGSGASIPVGFAYVLSTCRTTDGRTVRSTGVLVKAQTSFAPFTMALATKSSMSVSGNAHPNFGSYNSGSSSSVGGDYPTDANVTAGTNLDNAKGNIESNGSISMSGANISGSVYYVQGQSATATPGPSPNGMVVQPQAYAMPDVTFPVKVSSTLTIPVGTTTPTGVLAANYTSGYGTLSGSATIVTGGTYVFKSMPGTLTIAASVAQGSNPQPVKIYIQGTGSGSDFNMMGIVNQISDTQTKPGKDTLVQIFCGNNVTDSISINGNSNPPFYGAVYAPYASLTMNGNCDFYGSFCFNSFRKNGSSGAAVWFDTQLANTTTSAPLPPSLMNWQRL